MAQPPRNELNGFFSYHFTFHFVYHSMLTLRKLLKLTRKFLSDIIDPREVPSKNLNKQRLFYANCTVVRLTDV